MRTTLRGASWTWLVGLTVGAALAASCSASDSAPAESGGAAGTGGVTADAAPGDAASEAIPGKDGDLGGGSAVIDHSGAAGGVVGTVQTGALAGDHWTAGTCGDVTLAVGITDPAWSSEAYDAADPAPRDVHASFRFDTATTLSVVWNTAPGTRASWVAYGDSPDKLDHFVEGVSFTYATAQLDQQALPVRIHEAHLCGLSPKRTYYYAVGGDGYWGKVYGVVTAPTPDPAAKFRFGVVGDSNNIVYPEFQTVASKLGAVAPDWIAFTGDLVHDGAFQSQWDKWFVAAGDLFAKAPIMPAHGNHEAMATGYFAQFALPGNEEYYSFDYGQAHFVVLNDSPKSDADFATQATFADQDLAAAAARAVPPTFTIAMHHRPAYSSANSNGNDQTWFCPVYDRHHVDLVLNGHEHSYESTRPVKAGAEVATQAEGTIYVTTGGAGALLNYKANTNPLAFSQKYVETFHYLVVEVDGKKLTLRAFDETGASIDDPIVIQK